jgi:hypothetical protein
MIFSEGLLMMNTQMHLPTVVHQHFPLHEVTSRLENWSFTESRRTMGHVFGFAKTVKRWKNRKVVVISPFAAPSIIPSTKVTQTYTKVRKPIQIAHVDVMLNDEST